MQRVAIFIDGANVVYQQRQLGWKLDWAKLLEFVNQKYQVVSARYYTAVKEVQSDEQKSFHRMLAKTGYSLKTKILKKINDPENELPIYKGNLDIELVIDALTTVDQYDVFILLSGDSDFIPLISTLRQQRKVVKAFSTMGFSSIDLVSELGMDFSDINDFRAYLELKDNHENAFLRPKTVVGITAKLNDLAPKEMTNVQPLPNIGDEFLGKVLAIKDYGVFISNEFNAKVLLHIKNMNIGFISKSLTKVFEVGDAFHVKVENIDNKQPMKEVSVSLSDRQFQKTLLERIQYV